HAKQGDSENKTRGVDFNIKSNGLIEKELSEKPAGCKTLFIGNLAFTATQESLEEVFSQCGAIENINIVQEPNPNGEGMRPKGFGYVTFENEDAVDEGIKLTGTMVSGRPIRVDYAES